MPFVERWGFNWGDWRALSITPIIYFFWTRNILNLGAPSIRGNNFCNQRTSNSHLILGSIRTLKEQETTLPEDTWIAFGASSEEVDFSSAAAKLAKKRGLKYFFRRISKIVRGIPVFHFMSNYLQIIQFGGNLSISCTVYLNEWELVAGRVLFLFIHFWVIGFV